MKRRKVKALTARWFEAPVEKAKVGEMLSGDELFGDKF